MRDKDGKFYIGNMEAKIKENNIIVSDKEYVSTPGLWELIVATTPDDKSYEVVKISFKNHNWSMRVPFIVYADFE